MKRIISMITLLCLCLPLFLVNGEAKEADAIETYIHTNFKKLSVVGMSIGIYDNGNVKYYNLGTTDLKSQTPVSSNTVYEIGSLSKSFTALAVEMLVAQGKLDLQAPVSQYLSGFHGLHEGKKTEVTLAQLLHHTSGIGAATIKAYRPDASTTALEDFANKLSGTALNHNPGDTFEYATANYAILGAVIEVASGMSYRDYIEGEIAKPLGLKNTFVGQDNPRISQYQGDKTLALGHKISFLKPRSYQTEVFRNNDPAAYIYASTEDLVAYMKRQLKPQVGAIDRAILATHEADNTVSQSNGAFYGGGWFSQLNGFGEYNHLGSNPNYAAFISINPTKQKGIVVLTNSNSATLGEFANNLAHGLYGDTLPTLNTQAGGMDSAVSAFAVVFGFTLVIQLGFWIFIGYERLLNKRTFGFEKGALVKFLGFCGGAGLLLYGVYLFPKAFGGFDWYTAVLWSSEALSYCIAFFVATIALGAVTFILILLFPPKNVYVKEAPELVVMSLLSGLCNAMAIFFVNASLTADGEIKYFMYYFSSALIIYVVARRSLEIKLSMLTLTIIRNVRELIFKRLLNANLEEFEEMESGQVVATVTNDIAQIANIAGIIIIIITSAITVLAAFVYLATISPMGTLAIIAVIVVAGSIFFYLNYIAANYLEIARETQNEFLAKVESLMNGFKDLILHQNKRIEYRREMSDINDEFVYSNANAFRMFVNAFMMGEAVFIIVLGTIAFGFTLFFQDIGRQELTTFMMILIYILGPLTAIINSIPRIMQVRVAVDRVRRLILQLPQDSLESDELVVYPNNTVSSLEAKGLLFRYDLGSAKAFKVGPIDLHVSRGEILFIIGGNGSGKSTLLKVMSGLYEQHAGHIEINGEPLTGENLGDYISAVFADSFMFDRVYNAVLEGKEKMVNDYLRILELDDKVELVDGMFTTVSLSTGQRKRLHLLRCFLEDRPIYLFDELAADQDPKFRAFFYRTMLPKMRDQGKVVIAVTHDDHYFDVADRIIKLEYGQIEDITEQHQANVTHTASIS